MKANQIFSRLILTPILMLPLMGLLCSCATSQHSVSGARKNRAETAGQKMALQRELKKQQAMIEELRERNLVLERRLQLGGKPAVVASAPAVPAVEPVAAVPADLTPPLATLNGQSHGRLDRQMSEVVAQVKGLPQMAPERKVVDPDLSGDKLLYSKVLETYRRRDMTEIKKSVDLLIKSYPDSIHADNALYLAGLLAVEKEDRARAIEFLDRVLREYPNGNKTVASLFLKGVVEKQLGDFAKAKRDLLQVAKLYPGSPEAKRVRLELRLFELQNRDLKQTANVKSNSNPIGEM